MQKNPKPSEVEQVIQKQLDAYNVHDLLPALLSCMAIFEL